MNIKKLFVIVLIVGLLWNISMSAEGISVKLRGKLTLVGILSGVAFLTHTLVKRDKQTTEKLQYQLGRPEQIIQFERGFDIWNYHYYQKHYYIFYNDRFIGKKVRVTFFPILTHEVLNYHIEPNITSNWKVPVLKFANNRTFSVNPTLLSPYPLHQQLNLQSVSLDLHLLGVGRLLLQR